MKRLLIAIWEAAPALSLTACYGGYVGVGCGPYAYDGWYDDYYGPIYDGYWGTDGVFYYRRNDHDQHFHRGDGSHFRHDTGGEQFHEMHGSLNPAGGMHLRNFGGPGGGGAQGRH